LKKNGSPLEFMLRRQEFVEFCRKRDLTNAISYAKKHFTNFSVSNELEVEQSLALLAFGEDSDIMPYKWLYDPDRWTDIAEQFKHDKFALHGIPDRPQLISLIHAGLAALKTPQCCTSDTANINCPVCSPPLSSISALLPFAHHETSLLVCPISGELMDADNPPMVLPNGNVYSSKALHEMAASMGGSVLCSKTKNVYRMMEARKCFI
jgi:macrophage erythroblast attacher